MNEKQERPFIFPVMKKSIEELFKTGTITKDDLEKFQEKYWEQMVPHFSQTLKLLDIHDVSRHSILWNINDRLLDTVKSRIKAKAAENNDDRKQQKLWQKLIRTGMTYIHHPYMRSAIMMVLGKMNTIKSRHVSLIVNNEYLYKDAPLPVLRHIWMLNENKLKEELMNILQTYQQSMADSLLDALHASVISSNADTLPILYWPPRRRRRDPAVLQIVEMIGENPVLYDKTIELLRQESTRFQSLLEKSSTHRRSISMSEQTKMSSEALTGKMKYSTTLPKDETPPHLFISPALLSSPQALSAAFLCTVRFDLLMSFKEAKLDQICMADPLHHFVWCMDACIKNKRIDRRHAIELASHLKRQRKRQITDLPASEMGLDQDNSNDWNPISEEREEGFRNRTARGGQRAANKRAHINDEEDDDVESNPKKTESPCATNFHRDLKLVCRDPWVLYTVCSSLLRFVIRGLYEDKSPRNIPEVLFLVHLLMVGLEGYLTPPEIVALQTTNREQQSRSRSKRPRKHQTCEFEDQNPPEISEPSYKNDPASVLITQVLPAVAQMHLSTWRSQLCEEIRTSANRLWPKSGDSAPSPAWQRRLDCSNPFSVIVPPVYLAQPVGQLFLQYHALFALERREWNVLRALLRAAASAAQAARPKASPGPATASSRLGKVSTPPPTHSAQVTFGFRWRPECLQALALGIASLPVSSHDKSYQEVIMSSCGEKPEKKPTSSAVSASSSSSSGQTGDNTSPPPSSVGIDHGEKVSTVVMTRAELASLLRASLPLQTDLQLLVLAQAARIVPMGTGTAPATPNASTSSVGATPIPNFFGSDVTGSNTVARGGGGGEREKFINTLARHVDVTSQECEGGNVEATLASPNSTLSAALSAVFKSTNVKVLEVLEVLRRDMERATTSSLIPMMMHTPKPTPGKAQLQFGTSTSPIVGGGLLQYSSIGGAISSPNTCLMRPPPVPQHSVSRYRPNRYGAFPMATPLTNPGLSIQPPLASHLGSSSPLRGSGSGYPTYATPSYPDMGMDGLEGTIGPLGGGCYSTMPPGNVSLVPPDDLLKYTAPPSMNSKTELLSLPPPSPSPL